MGTNGARRPAARRVLEAGHDLHRHCRATLGAGRPGNASRHPSVSAACNLFLERCELPGEGFAWKSTNPKGPHECRQGRLLFVSNRFGYGADKRVKAAADWLLANQMLDGGWNCAHRPKGRLQPDGVIRMDHECSLDRPNHQSSLFSTMAALKGLASATRPPKRAVARGVEFLLQHRVHRSRKKSGRALYGWPPKLEFLGGGYDGLQPLRVLAMAGARPDERMEEALAYLESRAVDGRWPADNMQPEARPNKWGHRPRTPHPARPSARDTILTPSKSAADDAETLQRNRRSGHAPSAREIGR